MSLSLRSLFVLFLKNWFYLDSDKHRICSKTIYNTEVYRWNGLTCRAKGHAQWLMNVRVCVRYWVTSGYLHLRCGVDAWNSRNETPQSRVAIPQNSTNPNKLYLVTLYHHNLLSLLIHFYSIELSENRVNKWTNNFLNVYPTVPKWRWLDRYVHSWLWEQKFVKIEKKMHLQWV